MKFRCGLSVFCAAQLLLAAALCGCAKKAARINAPEPAPAPASEIVQTSGIGIELEASASGGSVYIRLCNNTPALLKASPYYFAVIIDGEYPEIRYNPRIARSEFPVAILASGAEATGYIHFNNIPNLCGQKLVFNSPDFKPVLATIKPYNSE